MIARRRRGRRIRRNAGNRGMKVVFGLDQFIFERFEDCHVGMIDGLAL